MGALLGVANSSAAGPWIRSPGHAYVKAGYARFSSDTAVFADGTTNNDIQYQGQTGYLYSEIGLFENLQAIAALPFTDARHSISTVSYINRWWGDAALGMEYGRSARGVPISLSVVGSMPLYDNADLTDFGVLGSRFPIIGDGQVNVTTLLSVGGGQSWGLQPVWAMAAVGHQRRTQWWLGDSSRPDRMYSDGIPWRLQVGWKPSWDGQPRGWMAVGLDGIQPLRVDTVTRRHTQLTGTIAPQITDTLCLEAGYSMTMWTRNAAPGGGMHVGLGWLR